MAQKRRKKDRCKLQRSKLAEGTGLRSQQSCLPSCARHSRARTLRLHRSLKPFRVRIPCLIVKRPLLIVTVNLAEGTGFRSQRSCLPSCARHSRARTLRLHRSLKPFRVRIPCLIVKRPLQMQRSNWQRARDSNPQGCYALLAFQASSLAIRSTLCIVLYGMFLRRLWRDAFIIILICI